MLLSGASSLWKGPWASGGCGQSAASRSTGTSAEPPGRAGPLGLLRAGDVDLLLLLWRWEESPKSAWLVGRGASVQSRYASNSSSFYNILLSSEKQPEGLESAFTFIIVTGARLGLAVGRIIAPCAHPKKCLHPNPRNPWVPLSITWQRGIKAVDGPKIANQLTLTYRGIILYYL